MPNCATISASLNPLLHSQHLGGLPLLALPRSRLCISLFGSLDSICLATWPSHLRLLNLTISSTVFILALARTFEVARRVFCPAGTRARRASTGSRACTGSWRSWRSKSALLGTRGTTCWCSSSSGRWRPSSSSSAMSRAWAALAPATHRHLQTSAHTTPAPLELQLAPRHTTRALQGLRPWPRRTIPGRLGPCLLPAAMRQA